MHLPPLNAVRAFEAAARHENFSRAAEELHVTQGAVSRHVKVFEDSLGVQLFRRHAQGVALTETGRRLLPELSAAFDRIAQATRRAAVDNSEIRVIAAPTLATRWLVPRLQRFQQEHAEFRVSVSWFKSSYDEFYEGNFDIGIDSASSAATGRPADLETVLLREEPLTPVCSPRLLENGPRLTAPGDLTRHVLLHASPDGWDWKKWFSAAGIESDNAKRGQFFDTLDMAVRAAEAGMGVTIGDLLLIQDELRAGRLVAPLELVVRDGTGYFLFAKTGRFDEPKIRTFVDWITKEANVDLLDRT
jgi:LysR family glycine cleavage system transcriptional activator